MTVWASDGCRAPIGPAAAVTWPVREIRTRKTTRQPFFIAALQLLVDCWLSLSLTHCLHSSLTTANRICCTFPLLFFTIIFEIMYNVYFISLQRDEEFDASFANIVDVVDTEPGPNPSFAIKCEKLSGRLRVEHQPHFRLIASTNS